MRKASGAPPKAALRTLKGGCFSVLASSASETGVVPAVGATCDDGTCGAASCMCGNGSAAATQVGCPHAGRRSVAFAPVCTCMGSVEGMPVDAMTMSCMGDTERTDAAVQHAMAPAGTATPYTVSASTNTSWIKVRKQVSPVRMRCCVRRCNYAQGDATHQPFTGIERPLLRLEAGSAHGRFVEVQARVQAERRAVIQEAATRALRVGEDGVSLFQREVGIG